MNGSLASLHLRRVSFRFPLRGDGQGQQVWSWRGPYCLRDKQHTYGPRKGSIGRAVGFDPTFPGSDPGVLLRRRTANRGFAGFYRISLVTVPLGDPLLNARASGAHGGGAAGGLAEKGIAEEKDLPLGLPEGGQGTHTCPFRAHVQVRWGDTGTASSLT